MGVLCCSLFWYALLNVLSSFTVILTRKRELVALLLLSFGCLVTVNVLWLFLAVPWVGLQFVFVVFPDNAHLTFTSLKTHSKTLKKSQYCPRRLMCIFIIVN